MVEQLSVAGTNFVKSASLVCVFGTTRVNARFLSSNTLECSVPSSDSVGLVAFSLSGWGSYLAQDSAGAIVFEYLEASNRELETDETSAASSSPTSSLPLLVAVSPKSGPESGMTTITVTGSNFFSTTNALCKFGGNSTSPAVFHSSTTMTCTSPSNLRPDIYSLEVSFDSGESFTVSSGSTFTVYPGIYISDLEPPSGPLSGGTPVRVFGTNFIFSSLLKCKIDSTIIDAVYVSSNEVICVSPRQNNAKALSISVSNNNVDFSESSVNFEYVSAVTISGVHPKSGPVAGGTSVTVTGANFENTAASVTCRFGSDNVPGVVISETEINCASPSAYGSGGAAVSFSIVTNDGSTYSTEEEFAYHGEIETFGVSPNSGPTNVAQKLAVLGANFVNSPSLCCSLGGSIAPATYVTSQKVLCAVGTNFQPGSLDLKVSNNCQDFSSSSLSYEVTAAAAVHSLSPTNGSVHGGTTVTVSGSNFVHSGRVKCHFGDFLTSDARFVSPSELQCLAPMSNLVEGQVFFALSSMGGSVFGEGEFTFEYVKESLRVATVSPLSGNLAGGTSVAVTVDGGDSSSVAFCKFGDEVVPVSSYPSSSSVSCVSPARAASTPLTVALEVSSNGADFSSDGNYFEYALSPIVSDISPTSGGQRGGTVVTINGSNFRPSSSAICKFGGAASTPVTYISSTLVTCLSPENLQPGDYELRLSFNDGIEHNEGPNNAEYVTFTSYTEAKVVSIFPVLGSNSGGTSVTVTGSSFFYSPLLQCMFDGVGVSPATFVSSTSIACVSPKRTDIIDRSLRGCHSEHERIRLQSHLWVV